MKNQNASLLQAPFDFRLLDSDFKIWKFRDISKGSTLIVLREMDLTASAACVAVADTACGAFTAHAAIAARAFAAGCAASRYGDGCGAYWKVYGQAEEEFEKTRKIEGFELLNIQTFQKLWISSYDMKLLLKNQT